MAGFSRLWSVMARTGRIPPLDIVLTAMSAWLVIVSCLPVFLVVPLFCFVHYILDVLLYESQSFCLQIKTFSSSLTPSIYIKKNITVVTAVIKYKSTLTQPLNELLVIIGNILVKECLCCLL